LRFLSYRNSVSTIPKQIYGNLWILYANGKAYYVTQSGASYLSATIA